MGKFVPVARSPWEDRFQTPSTQALLDAMHKPLLALLEQARAALLALPGVAESVGWQGVPWRWSFAYRVEGDPTRALAFLVPQPSRPQLAVPLTDEMIAALPIRKLAKPVRDAFVFSPKISGVCWPCWELSAKTQVDELMSVVQVKHGMAHALAGV